MKKGFNLNKVSFNQAGFPAELNAALEQQAAYDQNRGSNVPLSLALFGRGKEWQAASNKSYLKQISAMLEAQKMADAIAAPRNDTSWSQGVLDVGKQEGSVNSGVPNFYNQQLPEQPGMATPPPPIYSAGFLKDALDKVNAGAAVNFAQQKFANANTNVYNEAAGTNAPLQGAVSQIQNPSYLPYADNIINGLSSVTNNARQYGESNKQFAQEFPGQNALRQAQARKANAEAKYNEAGLPYVGQESNAKVNQINAGIANTQAGTKKIITEVEQLALKPYDDYTAASNIVKANTDALKKLGLISDTGVFDQNKLQSLDAGQQGKAVELQRQLQIARSNQIAAGERIKKIEGVNSQGKQTPGSKTLEITAPKADLVKRPWGSFKL